MNFNLTVDWKFIVAIGAVSAGIILAKKIDADAAERVSIKFFDAFKEYAIARNSDC